MKTLTVIYFKPKSEHFDDHVEALKKISPDGYICSRDEDVIQVFVNNSIEAPTNTQPEDLGWFDQHRHVLHEYRTKKVTAVLTPLLSSKSGLLQSAASSSINWRQNEHSFIRTQFRQDRP